METRMDEITREELRPTGLEGWLRAPLKCALLLLGCVLLLAAAATFQYYDAFGDWHPPIASLFERQLLYWLIWGLVGVPIFGFALWLIRRTKHWALFLLVQVPVSYLVVSQLGDFQRSAEYTLLGHPELPPWMERRFERERARSSEERDRVPNDGEHSERRPRRGFRPGRGFPPVALFTYWAILGFGAAAQSYLGTRKSERRAVGLELAAATLETRLTRAQVEALRSQLHPHFLFNALHSIGGLVRSGQEATALTTLAALGDLLRTTLDQGEVQEVTLRAELAVAESYLEIERIRLGDRLRVSVEAAEDVLDAKVPTLLLLPLVENAIQHGVAGRTAGGLVAISAHRAGEELVIVVEDDGPGFPESMLQNGASEDATRNHIGVANTRERLRILYGERHVLALENPSGGGARVTIRVPWSTAGDGGAA